MNNVISDFMSVPDIYFRQHHVQDSYQFNDQNVFELDEFIPSYEGNSRVIEQRDNYLRCIIDNTVTITSVDSNTRQQYLNFWQTRKGEIKVLVNFMRAGLLALTGLVALISVVSLGVLGSPIMPLGGMLLACGTLGMFFIRRKMSQPLSYYFCGSKWKIFKGINGELKTAEEQINQWRNSIIEKCVTARRTKNDFPSIYKKFKSHSADRREIYFHPLEIKERFYTWCNQSQREYQNVISLTPGQIKKAMQFNPLTKGVAEFAGVNSEDEHITNLKPIFKRMKKISDNRELLDELEVISDNVSTIKCIAYGLVVCWLLG